MFIATAFAQAAENVEAAAIEPSHSIVGLILQANFVIQLTVLLLLFFSVVSWAIIGSKHRQIKRTKSRSEKFLKLFWQDESVEKVMNRKTFGKSPMFNIFRAGIDALREVKHPQRALMVQKEIQRVAEEEIESLESGVPFLATTSTVAPFIGLFGTVWGVLYAFWKIGRTGASSLAVVGPHIAEALITTALGLAAAIPAVIFYNYFVTRIRIMSKDMLDFSDDLYFRLEKEYLTGDKK